MLTLTAVLTKETKETRTEKLRTNQKSVFSNINQSEISIYLRIARRSASASVMLSKSMFVSFF